EWTKRLEVLRGLDRLAHRLHEVRQRMQLAADQADDEVVVVDIEAVAGQPHVVGEVGVAVRAAEDGVLAADLSLLLGRQPAERAGPTQRIPYGPRPRWIQHGAPWPTEEPFVEILLEP